jgi:hypothetical protein
MEAIDFCPQTREPCVTKCSLDDNRISLTSVLSMLNFIISRLGASRASPGCPAETAASAASAKADKYATIFEKTLSLVVHLRNRVSGLDLLPLPNRLAIDVRKNSILAVGRRASIDLWQK